MPRRSPLENLHGLAPVHRGSLAAVVLLSVRKQLHLKLYEGTFDSVMYLQPFSCATQHLYAPMSQLKPEHDQLYKPQATSTGSIRKRTKVVCSYKRRSNLSHVRRSTLFPAPPHTRPLSSLWALLTWTACSKRLGRCSWPQRVEPAVTFDRIFDAPNSPLVE